MQRVEVCLNTSIIGLIVLGCSLVNTLALEAELYTSILVKGDFFKLQVITAESHISLPRQENSIDQLRLMETMTLIACQLMLIKFEVIHVSA